MTDDSHARAHAPDHAEGAPGLGEPAPSTIGGGAAPSFGPSLPPAAHTHPDGMSIAPIVARSSAAVLDSQPLLGFPGEPAAVHLDASREPYPEPPPFGFNAPAPGSAVPARAPRPLWPAASPAPRAAVPPRELMPTSIPVYRPRLGEGSTPTFGPPGRHRSVAAMVALSVLTLGFYAVSWHRRANQEMGDFDPRVHVHPARSAWAVSLPLLAGLVASAAAGARILLDHFGVSLSGVPVSADQAVYGLAALVAVPYLVLALPFSLLAVAMTAERVRLVEEHAGVTTDEQIRPAALVGWLLLPVLGGFVVMGRQQRHLNHIWDLARG